MTPIRQASPAASDAALLAAVANGDLGALGVVYDRYAADVWRVLHRVTSGSGDVEDLVHITFMKLPGIASSFDGRPSCKNWLCGIAVRLALRNGRSSRRFSRMLSGFADTVRQLTSTDPESHASGREELRVFEEALDALSPKKRAVFILIEAQGLRHEEVAEALEIPIATVRTRLFSAKQELRAVLQRGKSRDV